jgi:glucose-1-phosphate adenylyltransferase
MIQAKEIENCIVGNRSRIAAGAVMKNCVTFGNDSYETLAELANPKFGIAMGYGANCHLENCIIDKDVRIGENVTIIGSHQMPDTETDHYCIKEGLVIIKKGAVIPSGSRIV